MSTATVSSFLNVAGRLGRRMINERIDAARRERGCWRYLDKGLTGTSCAPARLDQAGAQVLAEQRLDAAC